MVNQNEQTKKITSLYLKFRKCKGSFDFDSRYGGETTLPYHSFVSLGSDALQSSDSAMHWRWIGGVYPWLDVAGTHL